MAKKKDEADRRSDMTLAPERPCQPAPETEASLIDLAEVVFQNLPGHRPEILGGQLIVSPPADFAHAESLTEVMAPLIAAKLHRGESRVVQAVGIWLPTGEEDYAIPDLTIVDAGCRDRMARFNCVDPAACRLVLEITSSNWRTDLYTKPDLYAVAGIPVYVIGDRKHNEVIVLSDPLNGEYRSRAVYRKGQSFVLPESIGAKVELDVDSLLPS